MQEWIYVVTLMLGWILGALLISAAVFVYVKKHKFGLGGVFLSSIGLVLVGLAFWQTISLKATKDGEFTISFETKKNIDSLVQNDEKINRLVSALLDNTDEKGGGSGNLKPNYKALQFTAKSKIAKEANVTSLDAGSEINRDELLTSNLSDSFNYNKALTMWREECMAQVTSPKEIQNGKLLGGKNSEISKLRDSLLTNDTGEVARLIRDPLKGVRDIITLGEMGRQRDRSRVLKKYIEERNRLVDNLKEKGFGLEEN